MSVEYTDLGIPNGIKIYKNFQQLRIVRRWFGFKFIVYSVFVVIWFAIIINGYPEAFSHLSPDMLGIYFQFFRLLQVVIGVGLTYFVFAGYINKTTIDVDFNSISIRQGPLPFWGNKRVSSKNITQLFCKREMALAHRTYNNYYPLTVRAITSDRRNIKLLTDLDTSEQALFIEQEIEKFLKIEDKRVRGEIR